MIKKIRQRRAQKPRLASLSISRSWKFAGIRIATSIFLLGIILYAAFAERIPLIGASCNEPESHTNNNLNPTNQKVPILTAADSTKAVVNFRSIIQNLIDAEGIANNSKTSIRILTVKQHEVLFEKNPHQYLASIHGQDSENAQKEAHNPKTPLNLNLNLNRDYSLVHARSSLTWTPLSVAFPALRI